MFFVRHLAVLALLLLVGIGPARAATASDWVDNQHVSIRLISASETTGTGDFVRLGLEFRLDPHWKIYWRTPGDAGFPPSLTPETASNLASLTMQWPAPKRFSILGFESFGYSDKVILPLDAALTEAGKPLVIDGKLDYLVCEEICIPGEAHLGLTLPAGPPKPTAFAYEIELFQSKVPAVQTGDLSPRGLSIDGIGILPDGSLSVALSSPQPLGQPDILVEGPEGMVFGKPDLRFQGQETRLATAKLSVDERFAAAPLKGAPVTLTVIDGDMAVERAFTAAPGTPLPQGAPTGWAPDTAALGGAEPSLVVILGLAVLGGLILNLMPCVLPVLSIKLLGAISLGGTDLRTVRQGFLASAAGIVSAFLLLAGVLASLKSAGAVIGWGIQFQHPAFLVALTVILTLFAANLWGLFTINLPGWIADASEKSSRGGHAGGHLGAHFLSGMFATVLATPCSAPFLGTAVGFALSRGTTEILWVFLALGVGLALPYLLVAALPRLAFLLPKPGTWMVRLRQVLGLALAATALWLISIVQAQAGMTAAAVVLGAMVIGVGVLAVPHLPGLLRAAGVVVVMLLAFLAPAFLATATATATVPQEDFWVAFEESAIAEHVQRGQVVFVDVTADWCLTCKANKSVVMASNDVSSRLEGDGVVAMKADWTKPNDAIADYLARHGRYGIPFNMVYGPATPQGLALPEILTPDRVRDALDQAAGTS